MDQIIRSKSWLLASDVDDTLLGDDLSLVRLKTALAPVRAHLVLAYNSSRPCASLKKSILENADLPQPHYLIGALGTEIEGDLPGEDVDRFRRQLAGGWQRDSIARMMERLGFEAHPVEFQTPFKASYTVPGDAAHRRVLQELRTLGLRARVIYSGDKNLDIIPSRASKGSAVEFLRGVLGFPAERVLVAGDSANDREAFLYAFKGIVVANSDAVMKALQGPNIYHARASNAAGVLEGLQYWSVLRP